MKGDNSDRVVVARVSVTWLSSNRASCYSKGMKLLTCIRYLLSGLALLGLVGAPLARPAMAMNMPAAMHAAMSDDAAMPADAAMAMPADMPCCPDKAPVPDCAKDCPLMALCLRNCSESVFGGRAARTCQAFKSGASRQRRGPCRSRLRPTAKTSQNLKLSPGT
jgi:hypothetical protein